jgi:hypothetical protein
MKSEQQVKRWLDFEWQDAMARTGFWRMPNPKDNTNPFSNEQTIARAKVLFIERLEKELEVTLTVN